MDVIRELEACFNHQTFEKCTDEKQVVAQCLQVVKAYATVEQCVAVMSDLAADRSYICAGSFGRFFGLHDVGLEPKVIDSIWEDEIYQQIHPDDLFERHLLELRFFEFLKSLPPHERLKYSTSCLIRASNSQHQWQHVRHRTLYLRSTPNNSLWLALCLYNPGGSHAPQHGIGAAIVNNETGDALAVEQYQGCPQLLTQREREVLQHVSQGLLSKEISQKMCISLNTVNRHRQNILEKLNVKNSTEAVKVALAMGIF